MSMISGLTGAGGAFESNPFAKDLLKTLQTSKTANPLETINPLQTGMSNALKTFDSIASQTFSRATETQSIGPITSGYSKGTSPIDLAEKLINLSDEKTKISETETRKVLTGESDNVHQAIISMQESGVAFSLMLEVRNQLVNSYKELMRLSF